MTDGPPLTNIVGYMGTPFANEIPISEMELITSANVSFPYLSGALRALRREYSQAVLLPLGSTIVIAGHTNEDIETRKYTIPHQPSFQLRCKQTRKLHVSRLNDLELLKRILGEMIAAWIRQEDLGGWIVVEGRNAVFEAEKHLDEESDRVLEVWSGFTFRPLITDTGHVSVVIDPRYKLYTKKNLREHLDHLPDGYFNSIREDVLVYDSCPNDSCPIRDKAYGECRLIGSGQYVYLKKLDEEKSPSDVIIGTTNLIEYNENMCPLRQLEGMFHDAPPVAVIRIGARTYSYPIERLRLRPDMALRLLSEEQRKSAMNMVTMKPSRRASATKQILTSLRNVDFPELPRLISDGLITAGSFPPYDRWEVFRIPHLAVGAVRTTESPYSFLVKYGPFDFPFDAPKDASRLFHSITISPILVGSFDSSKESELLEIVNTFAYGNNEFQGLEKIYGLKVNVLDSFTIKHSEMIESYLATGFQDKGDKADRLVHYMIVDGRYDHVADDLRQELARRNHIFQTSHINTLFSRKKVPGALRNVGLSLYGKCGGIPWRLSKPLGKSMHFIGLSSKPLHETDIISMHLFDSYGTWMKGFSKEVEKEIYENSLLEGINSLVLDIEQTGTIIVHVSGTASPSRMVNPILSFFKGNLTEFERITCVEVKKSPVRLYAMHQGRYLAPPRGTFASYTNDTAALATTVAFRGTPNPIGVRTLGDPNLLELRANEVFNLTNVFTGYERALTGKPVTTHSSDLALSMTQNYGIVISEPTNNHWFIQK